MSNRKLISGEFMEREKETICSVFRRASSEAGRTLRLSLIQKFHSFLFTPQLADEVFSPLILYKA